MDSLKLDTSCTALILVDLQRGIVGMPTRPYSGSFVVEKGASLAAATPSNNSLSGRRARDLAPVGARLRHLARGNEVLALNHQSTPGGDPQAGDRSAALWLCG